MLKSMTGFGKSEIVFPDKKITVEIKSLNSKNADVSVRIPYAYRRMEMEIRQLATEKLERGKIDVMLSLEMNEGVTSSVINIAAVKAYYAQLAMLTKELNLMGDQALLPAILRLPDSIKTDRDIPEEEEWPEISRLLTDAITQVDMFRIQEGEVLKNDIAKRINLILRKLDEIAPFEKPRFERIKEKIAIGLKELSLPEEVDKNRFEQEIIYYLEKLDVTEEKVRLRNHCNYFLETMELNESTGKKLGFITQEIGREINTLGSKASDSDIQKLVVEMKDELEKVKEQVLNVV